jgi:Flp pilus assembly protein TadG
MKLSKPDREKTYAGPDGLTTGGPPHSRKIFGLCGERGQAVTEFAMVLPLFALLVLVCILFGKALYVYIQVTHSANEGARLASVNQPQSGTLCAFLRSEAALPQGVTLTVSYPDTGSATPRAVGEPVTVTASTPANWVPFIGGSIGNITASATMRIEQDTSANGTLGTTACS